MRNEPYNVAPAKRPGRFDHLSTIEIWLSIGVPVAMMIGFVEWSDRQPIGRRILEDGSLQVGENSVSILAAFGLSLIMIIFGIAGLSRKNWQRLALAGITSLFIGLLIGGLGVSRMAVTDVMTFSKTGMTVTSPLWIGGKVQTQIVYAEVEWLRLRETTSWKEDWNPRNWIMAWMTEDQRGWRRVVDNQYLVKRIGEPEAQLKFGSPLHGAWDEIVTAARAANITVKPVERNNLAPPPN